MRLTRRRTLSLGAGTLAGIGISGMLMPRRAKAQMTGDSYAVEGGEVVIQPVENASFVMTTPGLVIYNDPIGGGAAYEGLPAPQLVLITHEHGDHCDVETLNAIVGENTRLLTNPAVYDMLPEDLRAKATAIANGESTTVNEITIDAIPAYNITEDRLKFHPPGRDNGYVMTVGGLRIYSAGDTEDTPEMRALEDIDIAFLPMNLPYTMAVSQAASAVEAFAPGVVYPYHYGESDVGAFATMVAEADVDTEVVQRNWYA